MPKPLKIAIPLLLGAGFLLYLVYSSLSLASVTCEVCVEFNGRTDCRTAAGTTLDEATQTAVSNACALISNGRDESIACTSSEPVTVMCTAD
jgi:hypothetical protein